MRSLHHHAAGFEFFVPVALAVLTSVPDFAHQTQYCSPAVRLRVG